MKTLSTHQLTLQAGPRLLCEELSLHIRPGECWAILGPNGSGKTTLLHTLAGLQSAASGKVELDGVALARLSRRHIAQRIGLLLQDNHDPFPATVQETVLSGRHPHLQRWQGIGAEDLGLAEQALRQMDLGGLAERMIQTLSGGERRRLAIATLMVQDTEVLLLDEPLNHLDLRHQQHLLALIGEWRGRHKAIVMVLHEPNHALHYCDHALLLYGDGRHEAGTSAKILDATRLSELYQCPLRESDGPAGRWFYF